MNIQLNNVRLSFPALFKAKAFQKDQEPKFSATVLLEKEANAKQIEKIRAGIKAVAEEKWGAGKVPKAMKPCLHDGAEKEELEGYGSGVMFLSASNAKRIPVVNRDLTPLTEDDGKPYAGSYVNVSIRLWAQDNEYGKRVNAQLRAVQFVMDGEAFGDKPADPTKEFSNLGSDDSESNSLM